MIRPPFLGRLLFSLALRAFPRAFRRRHGEEMKAFFADDYAHRIRRESRAGLGFWLGSLWAVAWNGLLARRPSERTRSPASGPAGRPAPGGPGPRTSPPAGTGALRDARLVVRGLVRARGYALTSVLTLALAIAATVVIYTVLRPVLLSPLPYPDADRLVEVSEQGPGPDARRDWVSPLTFRDLRERSEVFQDLVSYRLSLETWTGGDTPRILRGWAVSAGFFPLMGVEMTLGRGFVPEEDEPGGAPVLVLSHGFWSRAFGADPEIVGTSMVLDGRPHTVVGVAGPELDYPSSGDYWVPAATDYSREFRDFRYLGIIGRIAPGLGLEDAQAEMATISEGIARENPVTNEGWGVAMTSLRDVQVGRVQPVLLGMGLAVLLLFLIALGNVANLTLARGVGRSVDSAIRRALGAGGRALARLFVIEGLIVGGAGAGVGLLIAWAGLEWLSMTSLFVLPRVEVVSLDLSGVLFAIGMALFVGTLLGMVAYGASGPRGLAQTLRAGGGGGTGTGKTHRVREAVLVGQVALALALVIGASLLARSLLNLSRIDPGFEPQGLLAFGFNLPGERYGDPEATRGFEREILTRLGSLPGIEAVGIVTPLPMEMGSVPSSWSLTPDVRDPPSGAVMAHMRVASPGYLDAMGLRLLSGRPFGEGDGADSEDVVLVNRAFVDRYLSGVDPLGLRITAGEPDAPEAEWATIVGVVGDVRFRSIRSEAEPELYIPSAQFPTSWGHLVVRSSLPREVLVRSVTEGVQEIDPDLALSDILSGEEIIGGQLRTARLSTLLISLFALTATLLAAVGILGVLSILVAQRMREIGLRKALGAPAGSILAYVIMKGLRPLGIGLGLGVGLAVLGTRVLQSQVYGVGTLDPLAFVLPVGGFLVAGILVSLLPGARAASVNPLQLLLDRR